jgi:prepilin signal peptidase PulO-like enzyme (type II secretory pathway)
LFWYNNCMETLIFLFILGTIIGSFLNVVILRYGSNKSISRGGSMCPKCNKKLKWYELIPVLSWVLQFGKCAKCKNKISIQYPLVELATGVLFVVNYLNWIPDHLALQGVSGFGTTYVSVLLFVLTTIALSILIVVFVYDLYHKIIPDVFSFSFAGVGLILLFMNFSGWDLLAPVILYLPFYLLWRVSEGRWIGLGDGKLAFGFGAFLGIAYGLSAIVLSFWIGAVFAIGLMLIHQLRQDGKSITMKSEIPFGPFMIIAFLIVYFYQVDVVGLSNIF